MITGWNKDYHSHNTFRRISVALAALMALIAVLSLDTFLLPSSRVLAAGNLSIGGYALKNKARAGRT